MRLISIGRSASCTLCIPNEFISSYHAEIVLLDNGDIFLTDCGSKNGTYLNGKRIAPNVEVSVRRGDRIEFDNVQLNWGDIPKIPLPDPSKVKGIYGVGKHQRNRFNITGDSVSRYHATFKEMRNGQWFIQDHSKNGTFINGNRIPANQDVRIKASDSIICGTVPCPNPVPPQRIPSWLWWAVGGVAAALLIVLGLKFILPLGHDTDPYKATVLVSQSYRIKVKFEDDRVKRLLDIDDWYFAGNGQMLADNKDEAEVRYHSGTAFFISDKGLMLTNKHVTNKLYADEHYNEGQFIRDIKTSAEFSRQLYYQYYTNRYDLTVEQQLAFDLWLKSRIELEIETVGFGIKYSGRAYSSATEMDWAHLVKESDDPNADIAVLRLNSAETPKDCDWFDLRRSLDIGDLKLNVENYYTLGFPLGDGLATVTDSERYEPTSGILHLSKAPGKYMLYLQGDKSCGGQSGSPVYDKKHRLIGILYGGYSVPDNTNACPIVHAKRLLEDVMEDEQSKQIYKSNNAY